VLRAPELDARLQVGSRGPESLLSTCWPKKKRRGIKICPHLKYLKFINFQ